VDLITSTGMRMHVPLDCRHGSHFDTRMILLEPMLTHVVVCSGFRFGACSLVLSSSVGFVRAAARQPDIDPAAIFKPRPCESVSRHQVMEQALSGRRRSIQVWKAASSWYLCHRPLILAGWSESTLSSCSRTASSTPLCKGNGKLSLAVQGVHNLQCYLMSSYVQGAHN